MARPKPDQTHHRDLSTTLAQLDTMRAEDRVAILGLLDPASRLRVERLLRAGESTPQRRAAGFADAGYSPWLLARLEGSDAAASGMTGPAMDMLRACAQPVPGADASRPCAPAPAGLARPFGKWRRPA